MSKFYIFQLLTVQAGGRLSSLRELQKTPLLRHANFKNILQKVSAPPFKPPEDHLNCDPSLELEEMIVEAKPLHKKKKRLAKQRSAQKESGGGDAPAESALIKEFIVYNRYKELKKKAMEMKENEWQEELNQLMANSQVSTTTTLHSIKETGAAATTSAAANAATDIESIDYIDRTPSPKSTTLN